jgi:cytochrome c553
MQLGPPENEAIASDTMNDTVPRCRHAARRGALGAVLLLASSAIAANDPAVGAAAIAREGTQGAPACATCHGTNGEGNVAAGFPRLAGIGRTYLFEQLQAFAAGTRQSAVMAPIAKALSAALRDGLASWYGRLPSTIRVKGVPAEARPQDPAAWLAARGRWNEGLPGCAQCHGPAGLGVGDSIPPLAGQPAPYLAAQLRGWKQKLRPPGPLALMAQIADKLADGDIEPIAAYYAGLPGALDGKPAAPEAKR